MLRLFRRWPPAAWLLVYVGSGLIITGSRGGVELLVAGIALTLTAFGISLYLALRPDPRRPRPRVIHWAIAGVAVFYLICAIVAGLAEPDYGIATLLAGIVPATAVALWAATTREKSTPRMDDASAAASDDPFLGVGMDDETPLGDTTEHSEAEGDPMAESERRKRRMYRGAAPGSRR